jgi:outer membrane protein assembly factor BamB
VTTGSSNPNARRLHRVRDAGNTGVAENTFKPAKTSTFGPLSPTVGPTGIVYAGTQLGSGMRGIFMLSADLASSSFHGLTSENGGAFNALALDANGVVYNASGSGQLVAMNPSGTVVTLDPNSTVEHVSPVVGRNGRVYYAPTFLSFAEVDPVTRQRTRIWASTRGAFTTSPAIGPDGIVYVCARNALYALDPSTGSQRELLSPELANTSARNFEFLYSSPCLDANGVLYVGNQNGQFYAVDSRQGGVIARFTTGAIKASPAIAQDGTVFVGSQNGTFWALRLEQGALVEKGRATGFGSFSDALAIGRQGTVYITDQDGFLHAFEGTSRPAYSAWPMYQQNARHDGLAKEEPVIQSISADPGLVVTEDSSVILTVVATGSLPLDCAWFKDGQPISGASGLQLRIDHTRDTDAGDYSAVVGNDAGYATSTVHLSVEGPPKPPVIVAFSTGQSLSPGNECALEIKVQGTPPFNYVWTLNHQEIPGETNAVLRIPSVSAANAGTYSVRVSNAVSPVPVEVEQPAVVSVVDLHRFAGLVVTGPVGAHYRLEYAEAVAQPLAWSYWQTLVLEKPTQVIVDLDSASQTQRYYRAILQPY